MGKVYEIWGFAGLGGQKAMETAMVISSVVAGIYILYYISHCMRFAMAQNRYIESHEWQAGLLVASVILFSEQGIVISNEIKYNQGFIKGL